MLMHDISIYISFYAYANVLSWQECMFEKEPTSDNYIFKNLVIES